MPISLPIKHSILPCYFECFTVCCLFCDSISFHFNLSLHTSKYLSSFSIRIYFLLRFLAANPVVPLPAVISRTVSPSLVYVLTRYSRRARGFWVGCSLLFCLSLLRVIMLLGYLSVSPPSRYFSFHFSVKVCIVLCVYVFSVAINGFMSSCFLRKIIRQFLIEH